MYNKIKCNKLANWYNWYLCYLSLRVCYSFRHIGRLCRWYYYVFVCLGFVISLFSRVTCIVTNIITVISLDVKLYFWILCSLILNSRFMYGRLFLYCTLCCNRPLWRRPMTWKQATLSWSNRHPSGTWLHGVQKTRRHREQRLHKHRKFKIRELEFQK